MKYDSSYSESIELSDGTRVKLRLTTPADRDKLKSGFEKLSEDSKYSRFLRAKSELGIKELDALSEIDQQRRVAIGAVLESDDREGEGIGIARYAVLDESETIAEAAVTVVDEFQDNGLGTELLGRLIEAARERGIEAFRATLLTENERMRSIIAQWGPVTAVESMGPELTIDIDIRPGVSESSLTGNLEKLAPEDLVKSSDEATSRGVLRRLIAMAADEVVSFISQFWSDSTSDG